MAGPEPLARPAATGLTGGSILPHPTSGLPEAVTQPQQVGAGSKTHASPRPPPLMTKTAARLSSGGRPFDGHAGPRGMGPKGLGVGAAYEETGFPVGPATPKTSSFFKIAGRSWVSTSPAGQPAGWGRAWGRGRAESNHCLQGGCSGRETSGVYRRAKNRRLSVALPPQPALRGEHTHSWGRQQTPFYICKRNSLRPRDKTSL